MYQAQAAIFCYAVSPVHMGAGSAFGLIDSPIQRERHTEYPHFAGSGLKGALRHHFAHQPGWDKEMINRLFGPEGGELHAGAISLGDAQLIAFPVRSVKHGYVYATSALALQRAARQLALLGKTAWPAKLPTLAPGACACASDEAISGTKLYLETYEYAASVSAELKQIAAWLAEHALPKGQAHQYFRDKFSRHLVLLPDEDFSHFVKHATVVEPHVRIDDATGAASDRGLFYVENLPPESLLLTALMSSQDRSGKSDLAADAVLSHVIQTLDGQQVQIGGDATTGRGQVVFTAHLTAFQ